VDAPPSGGVVVGGLWRAKKSSVVEPGPERLGTQAHQHLVRVVFCVGLIGSARCDLGRPETFEPAFDAAAEALDSLDVVVLTAAGFAPQAVLEDQPEVAERVLDLNFTRSIAFCEVARKRLLAGGGGTLCVLSSVAGDRPRKPMAIYGAAKAGLTYYLDALDLRWRDRGLHVVCAKPGFVRTDMTEELDPPPIVSEPADAAAAIVRAVDRRQRVVFAPPIWRWVMLAIRSIPRPIFRRMDI